MNRIRRYALFAIVASLFVACSPKEYKPTTNYAKDIFAEPVITKVKIDPEDPDIGVYLQDEISKMAVNRLNLTLTKNADKAKGYILVNRYTINTTPVNKDDNGNVIRYSVNAAMEFAIKDKYGFWSKNIVTNDYVSVKAHSLVSSFEKEKAARVAVQKGLDQLLLAIIKRSQEEGSNKTDIPKKENNQTTVDENFVYYKQNNNISQTQENTLKANIQEENNENNNLNNTYNENNEVQEIDLRIIPTDDENTLIQDVTDYN